MKVKNVSILDKYQTPPDVAEYMVSLLPARVKNVLEPTPGLGNIVKALDKSGLNITAPSDYFLLNKSKKFDAVVMNPPFSSKSLILDHAPDSYKDLGMKCGYNILFECLEKADTIIALMPWYTISESDVRLRSIMDFGLKSITLLPRKTFNYARLQTCIIELNKGWKGPSLFNSYESIVKQRILNQN